MAGAVKFKLSEDLDGYETVISSEVYFIEWFPATSSLKVYYEFRFFFEDFFLSYSKQFAR